VDQARTDPAPSADPEATVNETSLWRLTGPALVGDPLGSRDGASLPTRSTFVVVGAGLAGLVAALLLCRRGHQVTVLEADELGGRTTSRTTGKVSLLQGAVGSQVRRHAGDAALAAYVDVNERGARWMRAEFADLTDVWEERHAYTFATTDDGRRTLAAEAEAMAAAGRPVDVLGAVSTETLGIPAHGAEASQAEALALEGQAQLHPVRAAAVLIDRIRQAGGRVIAGCRVTGATATARGVRVQTDRGRITAARVVLATGTAILDRSMLFATLSPHRQAVVAFRLPHGAEVPPGMYLSVDPVSRSLRTATDLDGSPVIVVGGDDIVTGRGDGTGPLREAIISWTAEHFAGAEPFTWWAAQDYQRTNHLPFAGPIFGGRDRILAMTGFAKWGMTNAPAAALSLDAYIHGESDPSRDILQRHPYGPRDVAATARLNLETGMQLVGGWVAPHSAASSSAAAHSAAPADGAPTAGGVAARVVRAGGRPVAESTVDGVTCRLSAVCPHLGGVVRWNAAERTWDCPLHGSRFAADGRVLEGPATRPLAPRDAPVAPDAQDDAAPDVPSGSA
jgi:glycine/D-amino acid oxidase-like deaminating enzyme/nitrite reductase/ring-hydroxylating ferredoxin subunit